jgi:pimeloyl-ACP methyl ester carboxylesterase
MKRTFLFGACLIVFLSTVIRADLNLPPGTQHVSWTTSDGVKLVGYYRSAGRRGHWVWVLLHGLGSNKEEWLGFAPKLAQQGDGFLIYDARGHGESIHKESAGDLDYREFQSVGRGSQWSRMSDDLASAVNYLHTHFALDSKRIAVGGASLGANVALLYASQHPEVPAVILLSPGQKYAGIGSEDPYRKYGTRPLFMAASPGDVYAFGTIQILTSRRSDSGLTVASGDGTHHGVDMLIDSFSQKLLNWISQQEGGN